LSGSIYLLWSRYLAVISINGVIAGRTVPAIALRAVDGE
jgi:hypothetical protein